MNKKTMIKFLTVIITALIITVFLCGLIWLFCWGLGIPFSLKYACPVLAFILLNKVFPFQLYHKQENDKTS